MANEMQVLGHWELMGSKLTIYGTVDEPMFLAKEVAGRIEHSNATEMVRSVDADEKLNSVIFSSGQRREVTFLTEYGLYEVLMQSRKPIARQFKRKVKEILRELRRTGKYDGEPVITVKLAAAHFGVDKKAVLNALSDKSGGIVKGIDYLPARSGAFLKFRAQNPGIVYGNTPWLTLIRVSGFRKLEARFRRTIGYGKADAPAPVPVQDTHTKEGKSQEIRHLAVPPQGGTVLDYPGFGRVAAVLSEGEAWFALRDIGLAIGLDDVNDRLRAAGHIGEGLATVGVGSNGGFFLNMTGIRKLLPFGMGEKGKSLMGWLTGTALPTLYGAGQQPPALPPAHRDDDPDYGAWPARARAQVAAFSTLLRSYERTGKAETRHGAAVAMEEAAEAILAAAKGMKSVAGEG